MTSTTNEFEIALSEVYYNPDFECSPRGQAIKERLNVNLQIDNPKDRIVRSPSRKIKLSYLLAEWVWYMTGNPDPEPIIDFAPFWDTIRNPDGTINSNYGTRLFGNHPYFPDINQLDVCMQTLIRDHDSRQAVMTINSPYDLHSSNKDVPCTFSLQFFIRQNKLHMIVNMRSNDIILGFCNDVFQFSMMHELMLAKLKNADLNLSGLEFGTYYHNAGSMHLYDRNYTMAEEILNTTKDVHEYGSLKDMPNMTSLIPVNRLKYDIVFLKKLMNRVGPTPNHVLSLSELKSDTNFINMSQYWKNWCIYCWSLPDNHYTILNQE